MTTEAVGTSNTVDDSAGQRSNVASVSVEIRNGRPWQNPAERKDVDGDGFISPRDVLALVLELNSVGAHDLRDRNRQPNSPYFDVSGDNFISPVDVLIVVTHLNHIASGEPPVEHSSTDDFFAALALSQAEDD